MSAEEQVAATPADTPAEVTETANATEDSKPKSEDAKPKSAASKKAPASSSKTAKVRSISVGTGNKKSAGNGNAGGEGKFDHGDIVLARLKGYPPWPARIADPDTVPAGVVASRPSKSSSVYCVNYFPAGDFSWLHAREITALSPSDIDDFLGGNHRKGTGSLRVAYETAKDPSEWITEQSDALRRREDEQREAEEGVDELEEEEAPSGGKRKRSAPSEKSGAKKSKATKKAEEPPKSKSRAKAKSAAAPVSAAENAAPADDDPSSNDPECIKVKDWRHKLQRAFLGKGLPAAAEMDTYNDVFNTIEAYKGMTIEALQYSKIGKVMKKIATLEGIPRNDELKITDRASKLMNEWHDFIQTSGSNGDVSKSETKAEDKKEDAAAAAPPAEENKEATNGDAEVKKDEDEKMEVEA